MAQIVINEISQNYTYNIGNNSYATVAMPITASWGPGFVNPPVSDAATAIGDIDAALENVKWLHFPATQSGVESFVSTFRGPAASYRSYGDYSYQMAMTLMAAGYDVLVCRLAPGIKAFAQFASDTGASTAVATINLKAKYPGTFGNKLQAVFKQVDYTVLVSGVVTTKYCWNLVIYVLDANGTRTAVENLTFVLSMDDATDTMPHWTEVESAFVDIDINGVVDDSAIRVIYAGDGTTRPATLVPSATLSGGTDYDIWSQGQYDSSETSEQYLTRLAGYASSFARSRFATVGLIVSGQPDPNYITKLEAAVNSTTGTPAVHVMDAATLTRIANIEWFYTAAVGFNTAGSDTGIKGVYDLLKDKLTYNPNRVISPGWDDQDYAVFGQIPGSDPSNPRITNISPIHLKLLDVAYYSRCATAYIDIPRQCLRKYVYNASANADYIGYAQMLARYIPSGASSVNSGLYPTHAALFAPWGRYTLAGMSKQVLTSPSFLALMIQRAQILNQPIQYEWALPTNRKHNLNIGKMDYIVTKHLLDEWQSLEGVGVNVITNIPDLGTNIWGNSTLYEVPPATYQALANLSTRLLVNAVENVAYRCGLGITFQYNNAQAYNSFYAGVTPILDTMKSVGAIEDYRVQMAADINGLDPVNANSVIGKIWLVVNGVINDIYVDLIALPQGTNLGDYIQ